MARLALLLIGWSFLLGDFANAQLVASRDGARTLINKNVNGERWAISYDPGRGSVRGNVLLPNGGAAFIDCVVNERTGSELALTCYGGEADRWEYLAAVRLPNSFFGITDDCQIRNMEYGYWFIAYADSCDHTGQAQIEFDQDGCRFSGISYDSDSVYVAGLQISGELKGSDQIQLRVDFFGACQGSASGDGSIVRWTGGTSPDDGDSIQSTVRGTSSCCRDLEAQIGLRW